MRGEFKLPTKVLAGTNKPVKTTQKVIDNDVHSSPYEVRVRPPADYAAPSVSEASTSAIIVRLGRSVSSDKDDILSMPVLSDEEARELTKSIL